LKIEDYHYSKDEYLHYGKSQGIGHNWFVENNNLSLKVPSILIPHNFNVLINPNHHNIKQVKVSVPEPLFVDGRLLNVD